MGEKERRMRVEGWMGRTEMIDRRWQRLHSGERERKLCVRKRMGSSDFDRGARFGGVDDGRLGEGTKRCEEMVGAIWDVGFERDNPDRSMRNEHRAFMYLASELEEDAERREDDGDEDVDAVGRAVRHVLQQL
uniref:Uncharacterized protein n=1 Tax=Oryza rufipogon TaxID=4529 RepID=A0A0E0MUW4_ORYRU